jgi:hypothetical protein
MKADGMGIMQWSKSFGGPGGEYGADVEQTTDGGYVIVGGTTSKGAGDEDIWLIKTDSQGNMQWDKTFGTEFTQKGVGVQQTTDGGYIIVGNEHIRGFNQRILLIKTGANGTKIWERTFTRGEGGIGADVQQTSGGGYVVIGSWYGDEPELGDIWLIKTDSEGTMLWDKSFGGPRRQVGESVQQTTDDGYIILGSSASHDPDDPHDVSLIKTDSAGTIQWENTYGESSNYDDALEVVQTADGGYAFAGQTTSYDPHYNRDAWLVKTDSNGTLEWERKFGGTYSGRTYPSEHATSVHQTADGGYVVAGQARKEFLSLTFYDVLLLKAFDPGELTRISLQYPCNGSVLTSPPDFGWAADGGSKSRYCVDLAGMDAQRAHLTWRDYTIPLFWTNWNMRWRAWNAIPPGSYVYWRVRGQDYDLTTPTTIVSDEIFWFYKPSWLHQ